MTQETVQRVVILVIVVVFGFALTGCQEAGDTGASEDNRHNTMPKVDFYVQLSWTGDQLHAHNDIAIDEEGVAGAVFHEVGDIYTQTLPVVHLSTSHGQTITFPVARAVLVPEDAGRGRPINEIIIDLKTPPALDEDATHEDFVAYQQEMYQIYKQLMHTIRSTGWERFFPPASPRITGVNSYEFESTYQKKRDDLVAYDMLFVPPDPYYILSFEEWRHLWIGPDWQWYAPGAYISVQYHQPTWGPNETFGSGGFEIRIQNDVAYLYDFDPEGAPDLEQSIKHYKAGLADWIQIRRKKEKKAKKLGLPIAEDYENPAIYGIPVP